MPTAADIVADFPEFGPNAQGVSIFATSAINYWITVAGYTLSNSARWGDLFYLGAELFVCHNLVVEAWAAQGSPASQQLIPGLAKGAIAAKSAGDVSISYNNAVVMDPAAQHWNLSVFGLRFWKLIQMVGMGPIQVGPQGCAEPNSGPAWEGPWAFNLPNPNL